MYCHRVYFGGHKLKFLKYEYVNTYTIKSYFQV